MRRVASNANLWTICSGYISAATDYIARYGNDRGTAASEGQLAHATGCDLIDRMRTSGNTNLQVPETYRGEVVPSVMRVKVYDYARMCLTWMQRASVFGGPHLWLERSVECRFLEEGNTTRVDFAVYDEQLKHLTICDLKYGHRKVEVQENPQLLIDARAIADELAGQGKAVERFSLAIYQPNGPDADIPLSQVEYSDAEVEAFSREIAAKYHDKSELLTPGTHCLRCEARGTCPKLRASNYNTLDYVARYTGIPRDLPVERMEELLKECEMMKDMIRAYETGLEALVTSRLKANEVFPRWEYSSSLSDRKWSEPDEVILKIGESLGIDLKKASIQSPRQAELLGVPEEVVATLVERKSTGLKLRKKSLKTLKQAFK